VRRLLLTVALVAVAAGCGSDGNDTTAATTAPGSTAPSSGAVTTTASSSTTATTATSSVTTAAATTTASPASNGGPTLSGLSVKLTQVATGTEPVVLTMRPGDEQTMYVAERDGHVRVLGDKGLVDPPVLDMSALTKAGGERGLLGLAFAADGKHLYVDYTDVNGDSNVDEYALRADGTADPASRRPLLFQKQPYPNHNGGSLVRGPDGLLYIGFGDGGSANDPERRADKLTTFLGKILRIDPTPAGDKPYTVPPDNPFVGQSGALPEIWSYGVRNPWRFSFDRATGDLWIGDVGQNEIEEVDHATTASGRGRGVNWGWSAYEGSKRFNTDVDGTNAVGPVHEYQHGDLGCSITGGFVYRGSRVAGLTGAYVFGDYCYHGLRAIDPAHPADATVLTPDGTAIVGFGEGVGGELYALSLNGPIYRIDPI
jgi:glucose/arabinose dehydrogenase